MIRFILVPVQVVGRMLFFALHLLMMQVIAAINAFFFQVPYYSGMIPCSSLSIPDRVTVKVANKDGLFIGNIFFVMMNGFPYLLYILAIRIGRVISPDSIK